jgi:hypothetical protein
VTKLDLLLLGYDHVDHMSDAASVRNALTAQPALVHIHACRLDVYIPNHYDASHYNL